MVSRAELRRQMRRRRRALSTAEAAACSRQLVVHLEHLPVLRRSRHVALYLANDGEIDPAPLLQRLWAMGKLCYLPVLSPPFHRRLWFAPYAPGEALELNLYGIPEPAVDDDELIDARQLDLVLMPLVAFDAHGNRLGMGGGYYDRSFGYLRHRNHWRKPHLLGLAYEFQRVARLDHAAWDVPLDGVVTEARVYRTNAG